MSDDPYQSPSKQGPPKPPPVPPAAGGERLGDQVGMRMLMPVGNSGWAIASGYLGLVSVLLIPAPLALITAILAFRDIKRSKETNRRKHGTGRAIFGLLMGTLGTAAGLLLLTKVLGE